MACLGAMAHRGSQTTARPTILCCLRLRLTALDVRRPRPSYVARDVCGVLDLLRGGWGRIYRRIRRHDTMGVLVIGAALLVMALHHVLVSSKLDRFIMKMALLPFFHARTSAPKMTPEPMFLHATLADSYATHVWR